MLDPCDLLRSGENGKRAASVRIRSLVILFDMVKILALEREVRRLENGHVYFFVKSWPLLALLRYPMHIERAETCLRFCLRCHCRCLSTYLELRCDSRHLN
jgi:hypothetical protein